MEQQNVIYIHTHDSGIFFRPYGYQVPTEGLMEFSKDATLFSHAFCASPTCSPSRSALVTGQYPHRNGMLGLANRGFCLTDYSTHMANVFGRNGYITALCGIQHEYGAYRDHRQGAEKLGYQLDLSADCQGLSEKEMVLWDESNVENLEEFLGHYDREKPFFLSFGFFSTHREYPDVDVCGGVVEGCGAGMDGCTVRADGSMVPAGGSTVPADWGTVSADGCRDFSEVYRDLQGHMESLRLFDQNFTRIIKALKENGQYETTIIIVTTDHGMPFPRAKCTLYDAGIRVALLMRIPGTFQGRQLDQLVSQADLLPTLCQLLKLVHEDNFDGLDFSPLFEHSNQQIRRDIFAEVNFHTSYEPIRCIRTKNFKYIRYYDESYDKQNLSNIDNSPTKEIYIKYGYSNQPKPREQFYDLRDDPGETRNLIHQLKYQHEIEDLKQRLYQIQLSTKDPILQGAIPIRKEWVVNINECVDPKSKDVSDFL